MDQLAAMRAFARVVEAGTFTRAADLLDLPKPTLTKLIQSLEAHVRTKLFNRTTRRVTVTPDGAAYYERVVRLLSEIDELDGSMATSQARPYGRLRVDVSAAIALLIMIPAMPRFHARYPDIQIDLGVSDRPADLLGENVDCVIRGGDLVDQSLIARRIGELHMINCATPQYLAQHGEPLHPRDIQSSAHTTVNYFISRTGRNRPYEFERSGESLQIEGRSTLAVNDATAYLAAALASLGLVQIPVFMAQPHIDKGELKPILTDWTCPPLPLHVVYPPNRHLSMKLRVFVDWIAELFATTELLRRPATGG